ncbi:MAG: tetratricopeptide repeat protein [Candidatus Sumerlaeia bacterium]|nr:tetratricopeptide repeat protein [Candidatus Sumerlaeia bacterium]
MSRRPLALLACALWGAHLPAQNADRPWTHTRYELLPPHTASFRIHYRLSAATPGQTHAFNTVRRGSECSDIAVFDEATGAPLAHTVLDGEAARAAGHEQARPDTSYIHVDLRTPVPEHAERRLRIEKTYRDAATYYRDQERIVFDRALSVPRNTIVLPPHYELIDCSVPVQLTVDDAGRLAVSMVHNTPGSLLVHLVGRPLPGSLWRPGKLSAELEPASAVASDPAFQPRAEDSRTIVYFLQPPETHSFDLYHDLTVTRTGQDAYLNWVRGGSTVANPRGWNLDTGRELEARILRGAEIEAAGRAGASPIAADQELVVVGFDPIAPGTSMRLRIEETYTDPGRYRIEEGELVWHRAFGRARNAVVLPEGWYPVVSNMPATITEQEDGRVRLEYANPRADRLDVYLRARPRRVAEARRVQGGPLWPLEVTSPRQLVREDNLARALEGFAANPDDEALAISAGRHLAWYGRFQDALALYTDALARHPDSFRLLRHRGHRHLTLRQFDRATDDLSRAAEKLEANWQAVATQDFGDDDTPAQYRWSTWYHLGLAHYSARSFPAAEAAFRRTLELSPDADKQAAATYWLVNALRQLGRQDEARTLVEPFHGGMTINANLSYFELMLLFKGERTLQETLDLDDPSHPRFATLGFGIANEFLFNGRRDEAVALYRRIVAGTDWLGFGHIGSEVELHALGEELP